MTTIEQSKTEIRALFSNEIGVEYENETKLRGYTIFTRSVWLAGMNSAEGKQANSLIVYAIHHKDGYWEQVAAHNGDWK